MRFIVSVCVGLGMLVIGHLIGLVDRMSEVAVGHRVAA